MKNIHIIPIVAAAVMFCATACNKINNTDPINTDQACMVFYTIDNQESHTTVKSEKEQMEAKSAVKVLGIVGISQTVMFGIMHYFILYSSYMQATAGSRKAAVDISKVSCILCGIMFIVVGNFMTKAKRNALVGIRTTWSMYNDNTWRKSNRTGAILIIIAGMLTIITTTLTSGNLGTVFMLIYILAAAVIAVAYSKKVYDQEIAAK